MKQDSPTSASDPSLTQVTVSTVQVPASSTTRQKLAENVINASIDIMIVLDSELRVIEWNRAAELASRLSFNEVAWKPFYEIYPGAQAITGYVFAMNNALLGRKCFIPSGPKFYLNGHYETHFIPLKDDSGSVTGVLQILHDVAHRIKAEHALRDLNRELSLQNAALRDAHKELASFAKVTAHDLKEPLRAIRAFAELTLRDNADSLNDGGRSNLERIRQIAGRIDAQADDIINFETLGKDSAFEELDLTAILQDELTLIDKTISETRTRVRYDRLPVIAGFRSAIRELLHQLIDNAIKFRRANLPLELVISCERIEGFTILHGLADKTQEYYHLVVSDNGIGFDMEYSTMIFEMFQRLHPGSAYAGRGIGLAIAQKAARMHDGFVTAESVPGEGSIFNIYLPLR